MRADRFPFTDVFLSQQGTGHYLQGVPRWTKSLRDMIFFAILTGMWIFLDNKTMQSEKLDSSYLFRVLHSIVHL